MDGYQVARHLRTSPKNNSMLLIALTGYGQVADRAEAMAAGFDAHFIKPVDVDLLCALIAEHCGENTSSPL
jgi:CheY-like chemotaxis protein